MRLLRSTPAETLHGASTAQPYGPYVSLDGLHPTAEGSRILADAAAQVINQKYNLGIPTSGGAKLALFSAR